MRFIVNRARRATLARLAHPVVVATASLIGHAAESTPARLASECALAAARAAADDAGWADADIAALAEQALELYLMGVAG